LCVKEGIKIDRYIKLGRTSVRNVKATCSHKGRKSNMQEKREENHAQTMRVFGNDLT
jgi:hypothetical protein